MLKEITDKKGKETEQCFSCTNLYWEITLTNFPT